MKKKDRVFREILYQVYEQNELFLTQKMLAEECDLSSGMVSTVLKKLEQLGAVKKRPLGFKVIDSRRILMQWACNRNLWKDLIYSAYIPYSIPSIVNRLPEDVILTTHLGFKQKFGSLRSSYNEILVYSRPSVLKKEFLTHSEKSREDSNLLVFEPDSHLSKLSEEGAATLAQIYVDAYNLGVSGKSLVTEVNEKIRFP